jgi:hypothetical protein
VLIVDRFFSNSTFPVPAEERGQDKWNAAVRALFEAAAAAK